MSTGVMLVVLFAAFLHAGWNALIKSGSDKSLDVIAITVSAALLSAAILPLAPAPVPASWPYFGASAVIHVAYFLLIAAAYRHSDMSHAYPLMRGGAPLLVAVMSWPLIGERLSPGEWSGVLLISGGILGLLLVNRREGLAVAQSGVALANAAVIATYTLVDGAGVRISASPIAYTAWVFVLTAPLVLIGTFGRRREIAIHIRRRWLFALTGGGCTLSAYILVLWAMTRAPVAVVAALRETAIIFGAAISAFILKERFGWGRPLAATVILIGVATLKLA